ncbi:MAG: hypothetical protein E7535_00430 [Ruminococcaceae bacterium]|nr:hypothetical protein [Oscillospiraceae bacterium]
MKNSVKRILALILCLTVLFSGSALSVSAADTEEDIASQAGDVIVKGFYNTLNTVVELLVKVICTLYPNPKGWQDIENYSREEIGFLEGRNTYQTEAGADNKWSLGYNSRTLVPEDIDSGEYFLGRDLMNKYAEGVYDDMRIRVSAIDDGSGEGLVVFGAIDSLGVTSTDIRSIRKLVLSHFEALGIEIASINIMATHSHSALDTQGVSSGFFTKFALAGVYNAFGIEASYPGLEKADEFKEHFINESALAIIDAVNDMEEGKLFYDTVDCSSVIHDKRDLISKEDLPETAVLYFVPDSGSENTYIADISCHPTSFSASNGLVSSDYIYHLDNYIKEQTGANFIMVAGAIGQLSRDIEVDETGLSEWEAKGASAKTLGKAFGKLILSCDFTEELSPVLNCMHRDIFIEPENSILTLACEINLVNNRIFTKGPAFTTPVMATELGYIEFGNRVGFALFPGEFYPETFWGTDITNNTNWDGTEWQFDSLYNSVEGVDVHCISLANDAIGYVLTDNNFAFMGHIIGEEIADEVLSVGKHTGSFLLTEYFALLENIK